VTLVELDRTEIERLLGLLDKRLKQRGVSASVYVVGGAAIAVTVYDARRTVDVDAVASDPVVLEQARQLADAEGIPPTWLNENARPWIPPPPPAATAQPRRPGLTVHWAPPDHLLAMKLVAARPQDAPDIIELAQQLGLGEDATAYADLLERIYDGEDALQQMLNVPFGQVRTEAMRRGDIAVSLIRRARGAEG
jgi:hypothetical protein